jgi:hypothetical protein
MDMLSILRGGDTKPPWWLVLQHRAQCGYSKQPLVRIIPLATLLPSSCYSVVGFS